MRIDGGTAAGDGRPYVLRADRSLPDIAPTVLRCAAVPVPQTMTGTPIVTPVPDPDVPG